MIQREVQDGEIGIVPSGEPTVVGGAATSRLLQTVSGAENKGVLVLKVGISVPTPVLRGASEAFHTRRPLTGTKIWTRKLLTPSRLILQDESKAPEPLRP